MVVRDALLRLLPLDFDLLAERERVEPDFALLELRERLLGFLVEPVFALLEFRERLLAFRVEPFRVEPPLLFPRALEPFFWLLEPFFWLLEPFFCVRVLVWAMLPSPFGQLRDPALRELRELGPEPFRLRPEEPREDLPLLDFDRLDFRSVFRLTSPSSIVPRQPPSSSSSSSA